jgi:guanosine-3',5'-bis(diphosphate) 3'-pyrophosphohydrolase
VNLLGSDRMTDVDWMNTPGDETYTVRIAIAVEDRQGVLADITSAVSNLRTNIRESRSSTSDEGRGMVELTVDINDVKHLQKVIQVLKAINGIEDVERVSRIP